MNECVEGKPFIKITFDFLNEEISKDELPLTVQMKIDTSPIVSEGTLYYMMDLFRAKKVNDDLDEVPPETSILLNGSICKNIGEALSVLNSSSKSFIKKVRKNYEKDKIRRGIEL